MHEFKIIEVWGFLCIMKHFWIFFWGCNEQTGTTEVLITNYEMDIDPPTAQDTPNQDDKDLVSPLNSGLRFA